MMLVKAGKPVDDFIEQLIPHLEEGDIIIDGGNTHFRIRPVVRSMLKARAYYTLEPVFQVVKKVLC